MGHPEIKNSTPFQFEAAFFMDENASSLFVPIIKASYKITEFSRLVLMEEQDPVNFSGEYYGDPETSGYKYEPECAFVKTSTDVVLIGHAFVSRLGDTSADVVFRLGPIQKTVHVVGDRYFIKSKLGTSVSEPKPFEKIPLVYERAFGGWDRSHSDPSRHTFEPRNPVGTGFGYPSNDTQVPIRLPNLEDPQSPWKGWGDRPPPAGFGFISPHWQSRASFAGTYDDNWDKTKKPLLPTDFDRRFFNAASPGLITPGYLKGNESVLITNVSPTGNISFNLPGVVPPTCAVELQGNKKQVLQTQLDTVIINTDENLVFLLWRAYMVVRNGPHDVLSIVIDTKTSL